MGEEMPLDQNHNISYLIVHEMLAEAKVSDGDTLVPFVQDNIAQLEVPTKFKGGVIIKTD
jgi:hypothetical protein